MSKLKTVSLTAVTTLCLVSPSFGMKRFVLDCFRNIQKHTPTSSSMLQATDSEGKDTEETDIFETVRTSLEEFADQHPTAPSLPDDKTNCEFYKELEGEYQVKVRQKVAKNIHNEHLKSITLRPTTLFHGIVQLLEGEIDCCELMDFFLEEKEDDDL